MTTTKRTFTSDARGKRGAITKPSEDGGETGTIVPVNKLPGHNPSVIVSKPIQSLEQATGNGAETFNLEAVADVQKILATEKVAEIPDAESSQPVPPEPN